MLADTPATSIFAVDDLDAARRFYGETLGIDVSPPGEPLEGLLTLHLAGGRDTLVYEKPDYQPATYTILNFDVPDVSAALDQLAERGIEPERYDGFDQDERGIARGMGPPIAWFTDPAGNILALVETG